MWLSAVLCKMSGDDYNYEYQDMTMVDFYDDIDLDFGDKLGVGEAIRLLVGDSKKKTSTAEKNQHKNTDVIVFEDEVDDDEYELYDSGTIDGKSFVEVLDSIAREVSEVTGNAFLNEQLEHQYRANISATSSKPKLKPKSKKSSKKPLPPPTKTRSISNKAELRKEMGVESDGKVSFAPRNKTNALVNGLLHYQRSPREAQVAEVKTEVAEIGTSKDTEAQDLVTDKMKLVRAWLQHSSDDDVYYSLNNSSSSASASYYSLTPASASEAETPRRYRATSKRLSGGKVTTSTPISDEKVNFAPAASASKPPSPESKTVPPPSSKKSPKKKILTKTTSPKMYVPGSYNRDFHFNQDDFPAIK